MYTHQRVLEETFNVQWLIDGLGRKNMKLRPLSYFAVHHVHEKTCRPDTRVLTSSSFFCSLVTLPSLGTRKAFCMYSKAFDRLFLLARASSSSDVSMYESISERSLPWEKIVLSCYNQKQNFVILMFPFYSMFDKKILIVMNDNN